MATEEQATTAETETAPTLTQAQFNAAMKDRVSSVKSKYEAQVAELSEKAAAAEALQAELAALREEQEMAGKTAAEQAEAKTAKERAKAERIREELAAQVAERDKLLADAQETLRNERLQVRLSAALGQQKVMSQYTGKAVKLAMLEIADVTHAEDGAITATFGDAIDAPLSEVMTEWVKANEWCLPAPAGAGSRNNRAGGGGRKPQDMSIDELLSADAAARRN